MNKKLKAAIALVQASGIKLTLKEVKMKRKDISRINDILTTSGRAVVSVNKGKVVVLAYEGFKNLQKNCAKARAAKAPVAPEVK